MRKTTELAIWTAVIAASLGLHAVAFGGLSGSHGDGGASKKRRPPALVEMTVAAPKPAPPPPPEAPRPVAKAPRVAAARPVRAAVAAPPSAAPPPPAEEAPADFTGVTMTSAGAGPGWASATGNGQAMNGAVGRPGAHANHRDVGGDSAPAARPAGPPIVGVADLSAAPAAPDLAGVLARAYPTDARARGLEGRALVRARIMPDGAVRELALLSESGPGFGAACRETLRDSRWSPPIDRNGRPVSTFINYTCRFTVQ